MQFKTDLSPHPDNAEIASQKLLKSFPLVYDMFTNHKNRLKMKKIGLRPV